MAFKKVQILLLAALLLLNNAAVEASDEEVRRMKSKATKSSKGTKSTVVATPPPVTCPTDKQHAAAIGSHTWAQMWLQIVGTGCDFNGTQDVIRQHLEGNVTISLLQPAFGVGLVPDLPGPVLVGCSGIDGCTDFLTGGIFENCQNKNFLSFSAHGAEIDEDDCMKFTVKLNEFVTYPQNCGSPANFATGRAYTFRMNENYVMGGSEPMAKVDSVQFSCPFDLGNTLVDCMEIAGGADARIDANYTIFDETPDEPGCIAGL